MQSRVLPLGLEICGAVLFAIVALVRISSTVGFQWPLIAVVAAVGCLGMGIAWERRLTSRLSRENNELKHETERQRDELERAREKSSALASEAALALRDSEALYHSLVDHLPLSVLRKNAKGEYTFVNRRYLEFSGKDASDIIGTTDFDQFPQELATRYRKGDDKVLATGELFEDVETYQKPDGERRHIEVWKTPVRDAAQRIIGTQVMFWDVTRRKQAEEAVERSVHEREERTRALQESEQNLQRQTGILMSILNSIADGVVVADENSRFVVWNPAADRLIGLGPMDKPIEAWPRTYGLFRADRTTPFPADELPLARAIRGETAADVPVFIRNRSRPEGLLLSVTGTPLNDADGRIQGGVVVFRDVTAERAAEEALRQSEEQARRIVETAYDAYVSLDAEGRVTDWNTQAEKTFGFSRRDAQGQLLADLIIPQRYREAHAQGIRTFLETGAGPLLNSRIEVAALNSDGHEFPVELTIWPMKMTAGWRFHAFVHDITERKNAEAEIHSKNQDLETLLYVISHDLREPLRAIENFSRMVSERYAERLDEKGLDFLSRVVRGAQRLDRLLEDVLTLSRVQRTAQPADDVDSGEIVADVLRHLEPRIRETQAIIHVSDGLPLIRADRRWATQAVQNLISNALKYTAEGVPPDVEIGGFSGPEGVGLVVRDRGMGVPADCAERIFQLFQRAVNRNIEGTGAGLAIVRRVAERHGGRAWVRPRDGGGSEFIITFGSGTAA